MLFCLTSGICGKTIIDIIQNHFTNPQILLGLGLPIYRWDTNLSLEMKYLETKVENDGNRVGPKMLW